MTARSCGWTGITLGPTISSTTTNGLEYVVYSTGAVRVDYYEDGNYLGSSNSTQSSYVWQNAPAGTHVLTAVVTDLASDLTVSSSSITVYVNAPPTAVTATPISGSQVDLSWTAPGGTVTGYNVYRGTTSGGENYSLPLNGGTLVATTAYNDTTVSAARRTTTQSRRSTAPAARRLQRSQCVDAPLHVHLVRRWIDHCLERPGQLGRFDRGRHRCPEFQRC